jgi:hypothetical protein
VAETSRRASLLVAQPISDFTSDTLFVKALNETTLILVFRHYAFQTMVGDGIYSCAIRHYQETGILVLISGCITDSLTPSFGVLLDEICSAVQYYNEMCPAPSVGLYSARFADLWWSVRYESVYNEIEI